MYKGQKLQAIEKKQNLKLVFLYLADKNYAFYFNMGLTSIPSLSLDSPSLITRSLGLKPSKI